MTRSSTLVGVLLLVVLLGAAGRTLWVWLDRPIERVSISGDLRHVSAEYLRNQLAPLVQGQSWLSVDIDAMRDNARDIGWLKEVRIHREWPDALRFELEEQRPVARWSDGRLLNTEGQPFRHEPVTPPQGLPDLSGPAGSGPEVLAYHDTLVSRLDDVGLGVYQLRLEARGAWRLQLDDGIWVMLGRSQRDGRLGRFEAAWQRELGQWASHIRYIDLRYPNGVSVAWHGETEPVEDAEAEEG
ncbi:cell division protein FtsQ/DivIB [Halomonas sp. 18H]|uniref:cell division protein FtsQ/DivIB n=1 Tax=Halomonas almeriensis TaxID=308163 RepID=UPI00223196D5|nr:MULTISPECIES: cell division protein FtsQ/DivIB [Halomonas]MCW4151666.1 cell division protein FtsQ/DivIB [Halomonas sp. 18H]MDN3552803.1 cell division protein FtsQ/DivIB [Halomonas almeriensis]